MRRFRLGGLVLFLLTSLVATSAAQDTGARLSRPMSVLGTGRPSVLRPLAQLGRPVALGQPVPRAEHARVTRRIVRANYYDDGNPMEPDPQDAAVLVGDSAELPVSWGAPVDATTPFAEDSSDFAVDRVRLDSPIMPQWLPPGMEEDQEAPSKSPTPSGDKKQTSKTSALSTGTPASVFDPEPEIDYAATFAEITSCMRWYGSAEYLLWWTKDYNVPALVTSSSRAGVNAASFNPAAPGFTGTFPGALDDPDTNVLFAGPIDQDVQSGGRFTLGTALGPDGLWAVEGTLFFLGERSNRFFANSNQFPVLTRPFFAIDQGSEFAQVVAAPGLSTGSLTVNAPSQLWGLEVSGRRGCLDRSCRPFDFLVGWRYLNLSEGLFITENITALQNPVLAAGTGIVVQDGFQTHNVFNGCQVGAGRSWQKRSLVIGFVGQDRARLDAPSCQDQRESTGLFARWQRGLVSGWAVRRFQQRWSTYAQSLRHGSRAGNQGGLSRQRHGPADGRIQLPVLEQRCPPGGPSGSRSGHQSGAQCQPQSSANRLETVLEC